MKRKLVFIPFFLLLVWGAWSFLYTPYSYTKQAKDIVSNTLKDPSAAEFRDVRYKSEHGGKVKTICGEVNGKNSFGAFTGYKKFIMVSANDNGASRNVSDWVFVIDDNNEYSSKFNDSWNYSCIDK